MGSSGLLSVVSHSMGLGQNLMKYDCRESELETALRLKNQHFESLTEARQEIERLRAENAKLREALLPKSLIGTVQKLAKARAALEQVEYVASHPARNGPAIKAHGIARQTLKEIGE